MWLLLNSLSPLRISPPDERFPGKLPKSEPVIPCSSSRAPSNSRGDKPQVGNILSTHSSQTVNQRFIEQQLDGLKGSIASILSNTEKILESCEPVADINEPLVENEPEEDSRRQVKSQPKEDKMNQRWTEMGCEPVVDSNQPEEDYLWN